jgi:flavin reductase (DIM6/NTAB) family NADH-FMN oxidoreductase RutF/alkylhydroperoxidase/carboxymuconolactone decarboxylase family protein YurZ
VCDSRRFRQVLGQYPTGVCVVTATQADGRHAGFVVGSFTSVSLEPPLVGFFPDKGSTSWPKIERARSFCVNVLSASQEDVCRRFASRAEDKFAGLSFRKTPSGSPLLDGVVAWIDCDLESVQEAGDHYIVLGRVRELDVESPSPPLVFFQGGYGRFAPLSLAEVRAEALRMLDGAPEGDPLGEPAAALIELAVRAAPTALDAPGIRTCAEAALDAGATPEQVHETLLLVAGLGFHTLAEGSPRVAEILRERGQPLPRLDEQRRRLWSQHVGADPYWERVEAASPGFLDALLRLSPEGFDAFFRFCSVPWRAGALDVRLKELMCMAADATPTHRYLAGVRLHLARAVELGAGTASILEALAIAAKAPLHRGVNVGVDRAREMGQRIS